jgi:hypothetical protein
MAYHQEGPQLMQAEKELTTTPTSIPSPTSTPQKPRPTPTPALILPIPTAEEPKPLFEELLENEGYVLPVSFSGSPTGEKYMKEGYIKNLQIIDCFLKECNAEMINNLIGKASASSNWVGVRVQVGTTTILYIHSSWQNWGPELGEVYRRILRDDGSLNGVVMTLGDQEFKVSDFKVLTSQEVGRNQSVQINQIFAEKENQLILVTCDNWMIPGIPTPKLLVQLVPK